MFSQFSHPSWLSFSLSVVWQHWGHSLNRDPFGTTSYLLDRQGQMNHWCGSQGSEYLRSFQEQCDNSVPPRTIDIIIPKIVVHLPSHHAVMQNIPSLTCWQTGKGNLDITINIGHFLRYTRHKTQEIRTAEYRQRWPHLETQEGLDKYPDNRDN